MNKGLLIAACLLLPATVALAAPSGGAKAFPVKAAVPPRVPVEAFLGRKFKETVTCRQACRVTTSVVIKARVARRLGFTHVRGKLVVIATNRRTLRARRPTKLSFALTAEARRRLPRAKSAVGIFGSVRAVPTRRPGTNYSVGWASKLT